jgi:hypothetical protein
MLTADEYVGHLATISAYLQLPDGTRERLLREIHSVLPAMTELDSDLTLHLARVAG